MRVRFMYVVYILIFFFFFFFIKLYHYEGTLCNFEAIMSSNYDGNFHVMFIILIHSCFYV